MSLVVELALVFIAAFAALTTMMTVIIQTTPWEHLDWRLLAIAMMSTATNLLVLWIALTVP